MTRAGAIFRDSTAVDKSMPKVKRYGRSIVLDHREGDA